MSSEFVARTASRPAHQYGGMPAHHKEWVLKETRRLERRDIKIDHVKTGGNIEDLHSQTPQELNDARKLVYDSLAKERITNYNLSTPTPESMRDFAVTAQPPHRVHHYGIGWQAPQPQVPVASSHEVHRAANWVPNVKYGAAQGFNQVIHSKAKMFALDKRA